MSRIGSHLTQHSVFATFVVVLGLMFLSPVHAEDIVAPAAAEVTTQEPVDGAMLDAQADTRPVADAEDAEVKDALRALLPQDLSPWGMFMGADIVVKLVLIGLVFASVLTWTVWLAKSLELAASRRKVLTAAEALSKVSSLGEALDKVGKGKGSVQMLVQAANLEMRLSNDVSSDDKDGIKERVGSRLERIEASIGRKLGLGTGLLATIGATAPFVGLFGTVWGIMNSFIGISQSQTTNLAVVAPGIAEALLATAIGLVAAIPAVVIYNMFARMIALQRAMVADAAAEVLRLVSRDLDRAVPASRKAAE